jgi:hypothetical protein
LPKTRHLGSRAFTDRFTYTQGETERKLPHRGRGKCFSGMSCQEHRAWRTSSGNPRPGAGHQPRSPQGGPRRRGGVRRDNAGPGAGDRLPSAARALRSVLGSRGEGCSAALVLASAAAPGWPWYPSHASRLEGARPKVGVVLPKGGTPQIGGGSSPTES